METNELITTLAKKGFLLDKESIEFFNKLNNLKLSEDILNRIVALTKSRMISKRILNEKYNDIKDLFKVLGVNELNVVKDFFERAQIVSNLYPQEEKKSSSKVFFGPEDFIF